MDIDKIEINFFFKLKSASLLTNPTSGNVTKKKTATIDSNDMNDYRAGRQTEPVNRLEHLNPNSVDMINVFDKIKELEQFGFDLLNTVPDNGSTCASILKYYIQASINRAKDLCANCIVMYIHEESLHEMNVSFQND